MTAVRRIPIGEAELSVACTNRCRAQFGQDVTLDVVAAKTNLELTKAGFRRRDVRDIREAAEHLVEPSRPTPDPRDKEIAGLRRQRDELHETANRYLERARTAEAAAAKAFTAGWNAYETGYSSDPDGCARAFGAFCINPETFTVEDDDAEQPCVICDGTGIRTGPRRTCGACNGSGRQ